MPLRSEFVGLNFSTSIWPEPQILLQFQDNRSLEFAESSVNTTLQWIHQNPEGR